MKEGLTSLVPSRDFILDTFPTETALTAPKTTEEVLKNRKEMRYQMNEFARGMNRGLVQGLINAFPRNEGVNDEQFSFGLVPLHPNPEGGKLLTIDGVDGEVYMDGDFGFALGYRSHDTYQPRLLAAASFVGRGQLPDYFARDPDKTIPEDVPDGLIIVQIEGASLDSTYRGNGGLYRSALPLIEGIQYQAVLVESVAAFADHLGISDVGILAASRNKNRPHAKNIPGFSLPIEQLQQDYDTTARNLGFDLEPKGIHRLSLV